MACKGNLNFKAESMEKSEKRFPIFHSSEEENFYTQREIIDFGRKFTYFLFGYGIL